VVPGDSHSFTHSLRGAFFPLSAIFQSFDPAVILFVLLEYYFWYKEEMYMFLGIAYSVGEDRRYT
jgi:hypothetical protein